MKPFILDSALGTEQNLKIVASTCQALKHLYGQRIAYMLDWVKR